MTTNARMRWAIMIALTIANTTMLTAQTPVASWQAFHYNEEGVSIVLGKMKDPSSYSRAQWSQCDYYGSCSPGGCTFFEIKVYKRNLTTQNYLRLIFRVDNFTTYNGITGPKAGTYSVKSDLVYEADYTYGYYYWNDWNYSTSYVVGYKTSSGTECPYSSYSADYVDSSGKLSNKKFSPTSVVVAAGLNGDMYIEVKDKSGVWATIGDKKNTDTIALDLRNNLVWEDHTGEATSYIQMSGNAKSIDNKSYDATLVVNTKSVVGKFGKDDIDWSKSTLKQGSTTITINSVDSLVVSNTAIGEYEMRASMVGADGKTYVLTGLFSPECPIWSGVGGSWAAFTYTDENDSITNEMILDKKNEWLFAKTYIARISAYNTARTTQNYAQIGIDLGSDTIGKTYLYTNGVGPKPGCYRMRMPYIEEAGEFDNYNNLWYIPDKYLTGGPLAIKNNSYYFIENSIFWRCPYGSFGSVRSAKGEVEEKNTYSFNDAIIVVRVGKGGNIFVAALRNGDAVVTIGEPAGYVLQTNVVGQGTINQTSDDCSSATGAEIELTPVAASGWSFEKWSGECLSQLRDNHDGTYTFTVGMNDCALTAHFVESTEIVDKVTLCPEELGKYTWRKWHNGGILITSPSQDGIKDTVWKGSDIDSIFALKLTVLPEALDSAYSRTICYGEKYADTHFTDSIATSGEYYKNIVYAGKGCDSVVYKLSLTVQSTAQDSTYSKTICYGESYSDAHFQNLSSTDTYKKHLKYQGMVCDSFVYTLHLTVLPETKVIDYSRIICEGESYSDAFFSGLTKEDTYYKTIKFAGQNCDSAQVTLDLKVQKAQYAAKEKQSILAGEEYNWIGHVGFEHLTKSGVYKDTAYYLSGCDSVYYELTLEVISLECKELSGLSFKVPETTCADDENILVEMTFAEGAPYAYSIHFSKEAQAAGFVDQNDIAATRQNPFLIEVDIPEGDGTHEYVQPDTYQMSIVVEDTCGDVKETTHRFTILYPSWVIVQKWNDVLAVLNTQYNGGYEFSRIEWYRNGQAIAGGGNTNSYVYAGANQTLQMGVPYWAELTRKSDNKTIRTCEFVPQPQNGQNPWKNDKKVVIRRMDGANNRQLKVISELSGTYTMYSLSGQMVMNGVFGAEYGNPTVDTGNLPAGVYLFIFQGNDGTTESEKMVIQ